MPSGKRANAGFWFVTNLAGGKREIRGNTSKVGGGDRKSTRLNSSHLVISYAVFCLKKKKNSADQLPPGHQQSAHPSIPPSSAPPDALSSLEPPCCTQSHRAHHSALHLLICIIPATS